MFPNGRCCGGWSARGSCCTKRSATPSRAFGRPVEMAIETRLDDLLVEWEERRQRGEEAAPEDLCRDAPDLLPHLKASIESLKSTDWLFSESDDQTPSAAGALFDDTAIPASHLTVQEFASSVIESGLLSPGEIEQ